jgi:hypothetical protein
MHLEQIRSRLDAIACTLDDIRSNSTWPAILKTRLAIKELADDLGAAPTPPDASPTAASRLPDLSLRRSDFLQVVAEMTGAVEGVGWTPYDPAPKRGRLDVRFGPASLALARAQRIPPERIPIYAGEAAVEYVYWVIQRRDHESRPWPRPAWLPADFLAVTPADAQALGRSGPAGRPSRLASFPKSRASSQKAGRQSPRPAVGTFSAMGA